MNLLFTCTGIMHERCLVKSPRAKRQKTDHVDRISSLPDPMLISILSLLTTKEAVQTSVLAKRYRNLWVSVPGLEFDFDDFLPSLEILEKLEETDEDLSEYEEKFVKFVDRVFEHRGPLNLDSFKLVWTEDDSDPIRATAWLDIVAKLKTKFLFVHIFSENYNFEVPDSVFASQLLQELVLHLGFEVITPRSVNLPCLKRLTLDSVEIREEVMQKLLSGSPALEEMVLSDCLLSFCDISSCTLKRLIIDGYHNEKAPEILISIPSLVYLEVRCWAMGKLKFKNLKSLVKAQIHFHDLSDDEPLFLTALSNVTSLELVLSVWGLRDMKDLLEKETTKFPTFNNLKTLKIGGWSLTHDFDLVDHFLLHAPNLEKLTLLHRERLTCSNLELSLGLGDCLDIVETTYEQNDKSASELAKIVETHFKTIREAHHIPQSCNL
ncbi:F-box/RNI-like superfamily protein [Rhynchospora pubera]|uniref:F-box/RNI-like superfamily protein n=1 Tax=Rhynchospora pubera TaxID=906938 RepID=A0AAV8DS00_9POAL|nr:F-box/RNI-like superfamily protein [Rhynchospora pubera]